MPITEMNFAEYKVAIKLQKKMKKMQSPLKIDLKEHNDNSNEYVTKCLTNLMISSKGRKVFQDRTHKQRFFDILIRILIEKNLIITNYEQNICSIKISSRCIDLIYKTKKELRLYQLNFISIIITLIALLVSIIFNILVLNK